MIDHKSIFECWTHRDSLLLLLLILLALLMFGVALDAGEFWWTDESRHAMDGVYILDIMRDWPLTHLYDYTVQYFLRYPALGLTWYPPFFAFIESLVFAAVGISEFAARLTVLIFLLVGIVAWYAWAQPIWGRAIAFTSILFFLVNPYVILWGRSVMLEIPAIAMMMLALFSFHQYLRKPTHNRSIITGLIIASMLLTKQVTAFILPLMIIYAIQSKEWKRLLLPQSIWAYLFAIIALALLTVHAVSFGNTALGNIEKGVGQLLSTQLIGRLQVSSQAVVDAYAFPLLLLSGIGLLIGPFLKSRSSNIFAVTWVVVWFLFFLFISSRYNNLLRYTIYLTPALGLLASIAISALPRKFSLHRIGVVAVIILYAGYGYAELRREHPALNGYGEMARFILEQDVSGTVLFCCKHDGNFVMHIKEGDKKRQQIILRADKTLVSMAVHKSYGVTSNVGSKEDFYSALDKYGVDLIVTENKDVVGLPEFEMLLSELGTDRFQLLKEIDIRSNVSDFYGIKLRAHRYLDSKPITNGEIVIPLPHLGRELKMRIGR